MELLLLEWRKNAAILSFELVPYNAPPTLEVRFSISCGRNTSSTSISGSTVTRLQRWKYVFQYPVDVIPLRLQLVVLRESPMLLRYAPKLFRVPTER